MLREARDLSYRVYVTDSLKLSGEHKYIERRWYDLVKPQPEMDADEIATDVIKRAGLVIE